MRLIAELYGRVFVLQFQHGKAASADEEEKPEFEHAPVDPHSVGGGQVERSENFSASIHGADPVAERRFGFGSQGSGRQESD